MPRPAPGSPRWPRAPRAARRSRSSAAARRSRSAAQLVVGALSRSSTAARRLVSAGQAAARSSATSFGGERRRFDVGAVRSASASGCLGDTLREQRAEFADPASRAMMPSRSCVLLAAQLVAQLGFSASSSLSRRMSARLAAPTRWESMWTSPKISRDQRRGRRRDASAPPNSRPECRRASTASRHSGAYLVDRLGLLELVDRQAMAASSALCSSLAAPSRCAGQQHALAVQIVSEAPSRAQARPCAGSGAARRSTGRCRRSSNGDGWTVPRSLVRRAPRLGSPSSSCGSIIRGRSEPSGWLRRAPIAPLRR